MTTITKLVDDFSVVLTDAEDLLKRAANETGDKARDLRSEVESKLKAAKLRLGDLEVKAAESVRAGTRATDAYVHEKPWQAVGIAAVLGIVLGALISRR